MIFERLPSSHQAFIEEKNKGFVLTPKMKDYFATALIHRSYAVEHNLDVDNERLEFLGDAALGLSVSDVLYHRFEEKSEGFMSKRRAGFVNEEMLTYFGISIGLNDFILLGKGEKRSNGSEKPSIVSAALEAWIGAIFLSHGYDVTHETIKTWSKKHLNNIEEIMPTDYKSKLQEEVQRIHHVSPVYKVLEEKGPDHSKEFVVGAFIIDRLIGKSQGKSKKKAQQAAAREAIKQWNEQTVQPEA